MQVTWVAMIVSILFFSELLLNQNFDLADYHVMQRMCCDIYGTNLPCAKSRLLASQENSESFTSEYSEHNKLLCRHGHCQCPLDWRHFRSWLHNFRSRNVQTPAASGLLLPDKSIAEDIKRSPKAFSAIKAPRFNPSYDTAQLSFISLWVTAKSLRPTGYRSRLTAFAIALLKLYLNLI